MRKISAKLSVSLFLCLAPYLASDALAAIPRFAHVSASLSRGGRPESSSDLRQLKSDGFKTVISLENIPFMVKGEEKQVKALGMRFLSVPLDWDEEPSDADIDQILSALWRESGSPVFLHCYHGTDRTGLVVALYRVLKESWDPERAYREMLKMGFNTKFKELSRYFERRTGYQP